MTEPNQQGPDNVDIESMRREISAFQIRARSTAVYPSRGLATGRMYVALGLAGEAGEVAEQVKKHWRNQDGKLTPDRRAAIRNELGDVLWYAAMMAEECQIQLGDCAVDVLEKLRIRADSESLKHE